MKNSKLFSTKILLKSCQHGGKYFHHMMIYLFPAIKDKLFHPLESKWGNISNNRGLWEQSIKNMASPNRPYSQETKYSFSALVTNIQTNQYLQNRDGCTFPNEMVFHSKMSVFWHQTCREKVFVSTKLLSHGILLTVKNEEKETFSLAPWDVQMSPGGQGLELWLGSYLVLIWSPWSCCPHTEHSTPQSTVCRKGHRGSALWVSHSSHPLCSTFSPTKWY